MSVQAITWALDYPTGSVTEKVLLLVLANYANEFGVSWPSQKTLADQTALGERTVRRVLSALDERGVIRRLARRRGNGSRQSDMILLAAFEGRKPAPPGMLDVGLDEGSDEGSDGPNSGPDVAKSGPAQQPANRDNRPLRPLDNRPPDPDPPATVAALDTSKILKSLAYADTREDDPDTADPLQACLAVAGPGFEPGAQPDHVSAFEVARWIERGFDLDLDVLPVIAAKTKERRPSPIRTFDYFTPAIAEFHARRLAQRAGGGLAGERGAGRTGSAITQPQHPGGAGQAEAPPDTARLIAGWINTGRYVPPSAVSTTMRNTLLARGLVTEEALRALQIY